MSNIIDLSNRERGGGPRVSIVGYAIIFFVILVGLVMYGPSLMSDARLFGAQYTDDYYAFTVEGGHTFFGTVRGVGWNKIILADAYSFQSIEVGETSTNNLVALSENPFTLPENWLVLNRAHILFYEKIGKDASIMSAINAQ